MIGLLTAILTTFRQLFVDKRWPYKLGGLLVLGCIPGLNVLAWVGYQQSMAVNIAQRRPVLLPTWDDWADILVRGLLAVMASGVYWLPGLLLWLFSLLPGLRIVILPALIGAALCMFALSVSHVRYARTDQPSRYTWPDWRQSLRNGVAAKGSAAIGLYAISFIGQSVVFGLALLLTPLALVTVVGPMLIWSAVSVINGCLIGQTAARTVRA